MGKQERRHRRREADKWHKRLLKAGTVFVIAATVALLIGCEAARKLVLTYVVKIGL